MHVKATYRKGIASRTHYPPATYASATCRPTRGDMTSEKDSAILRTERSATRPIALLFSMKTLQATREPQETATALSDADVRHANGTHTVCFYYFSPPLSND